MSAGPTGGSMNSRIFLLACCAVMPGLGGCGPAAVGADGALPAAAVAQPAPTAGWQGIEALVHAAMTDGMKQEHIPGAAIVVVRNREVVFARGYGLADVASARPFTPDRTIFPIASVSKLFTATA